MFQKKYVNGLLRILLNGEAYIQTCFGL